MPARIAKYLLEQCDGSERMPVELLEEPETIPLVIQELERLGAHAERDRLNPRKIWIECPPDTKREKRDDHA